ncbi:MAG: HEPN domain-containing protein [Sphingomonas sp.]|jgi:predicted nucleotidyltransferase|uniref:HEPN domain-containing protein n=1 Tax=Sphingomonas sp. TaxID=28214 RepID=UPI003562BB56
MRDQLDHLPASKQRELAHVVRVLFEEFEAAHATGTQKWKKQGRILKLVLYGSYARGDWVDDPIGGYTSDYDILIVVNDERLTDFELWSAAEDRLMRDLTINKALSAPVSFIVHTLTEVNQQLERGRPFFVDILKQGIALYEAEGFSFAAPRDLPPEEARAEAKEHFDRWFGIASRSFRTFELQRSEGDDPFWRNKAVFELHQATEQLYHCVLLVLTLYSPKSHRLKFLRSQSEQIAPSLIGAWPRDDKFSRRCFELLRQAYVNARYSPHYEVSGEELDWLGNHASDLRSLVQAACSEHLAGNLRLSSFSS